MKLFTNGCSFTWGAEIVEQELKQQFRDYYLPEHEAWHDFRKSNIWAYHLHKKLKTEDLINLSEGGSSNKRIIRTTLDFFIERINKNLPVDDFIAVIQWTDISRFEIFDFELNDYVKILPYSTIPKLPEDRRKILQYRFYEHPINDVNNFLIDITTLSSFFKLYNIKYLFATLGTYPDIPSGFYTDDIKWLSNNRDKCSFSKLITHHIYPEHHPNIIGHRIISESVYNKLIDTYNIKINSEPL